MLGVRSNSRVMRVLTALRRWVLTLFDDAMKHQDRKVAFFYSILTTEATQYPDDGVFGFLVASCMKIVVFLTETCSFRSMSFKHRGYHEFSTIKSSQSIKSTRERKSSSV